MNDAGEFISRRIRGDQETKLKSDDAPGLILSAGEKFKTGILAEVHSAVYFLGQCTSRLPGLSVAVVSHPPLDEIFENI